MPRVLIVSLPSPGHALPMLGLGKGLLAAGFEVHWASPAKTPKCVQAVAGVEAVVFEDQRRERPFKAVGIEIAARDYELQLENLRYQMVTVVEAELDIVRGLIGQIQPDVVITSYHLGSVCMAAQMEEVPVFTIWTNFSLFADEATGWNRLPMLEALEAERARLHRRHGVFYWPKIVGSASPDANAILAVPEMVASSSGLKHLPPNSRFVGLPRPEHPGPAFDWTQLDQRPLIFSAFGGDGAEPLALMDRLYEAVSSLPVQLLAVDHRAADETFRARLSENVLPMVYAPQSQALDRARAFVTHGGSGSTGEALDRGVPMLVCPVHRDQPMQAHFLEKAGCALRMDTWNASAADLRQGLERLLADDSMHAQAARRLQAAIQTHQSTQIMVDWVERLARGQK
jgi:MGT family glycosyltransferase